MVKDIKKGLPVDSFNLSPGSSLTRKYEIICKLGSGWEGEVYKIRERSTSTERAAKLFFPQRNPRNKTSKIDVIIGTFCLHHRFALLHDDRDFEPIEKYLKLETIQV